MSVQLTPAVAIVIPVFNDTATLEACLRAVFAHTQYADWRVIVVDDGSTDKPSEVAKKFPSVRFVKKARSGVASALNVGFAQAAGLDVVRLHGDVVIQTPDWLSRLVTAAYAKAKPSVVGIRLVYPDGRIHSEGHSFVSGLGVNSSHFARRAFLPDGGPTGLQEVDGVPGGLTYYPREILNRVGRLDEGYGPAWFEDDDFCFGARVAGYKVFVHGGVKAVHFTRGQPPTALAVLPEADSEIQRLTTHVKAACHRLQADYWEAKWGWHPIYPDLNEVRRLYGHTEVCWQIGAPMEFKPSGKMPTVDCCLVTWNTLGLLRRCLESLALTDYAPDKVNVYITDNASTDGTVEYLNELKKTYPFALHVVPLGVNTGAPIGMNFAFVQGRGELVARLDDDIVLPADWLKRLVSAFFLRPYAGCVGPKILNDDARRTIQCGPYRHYPSIYGHEGEDDRGQADYLARATHVRGCCNLYRRDTFARCGLLDGRFSPSQFDDPDHHLALVHAGYEIIYDGRVGVVHKLNSGLGRSAAAVSNQMANHSKLHGKWGREAYEVLERSIDLSREGRYLPDDGDTKAWQAMGPSPTAFPRKVPNPGARAASMLRPYAELCECEVRPLTAQLVAEHVLRAELCSSTNVVAGAIDILQVALNFAPAQPQVLAALAKSYHSIGQTDLGSAIARNGLLLAPEDAGLCALADSAAIAPAATAIFERPNAIGEQAVVINVAIAVGAPAMRVLMVNTYENRLSGGDMHQLKKTRQYLEKLGVHVDLCCTPRPDPTGYDVVHLWNTWFPAQTAVQAKAIRVKRPHVPIVLSPIFWDMREKVWADGAIPALFSTSTSPAQLEDRLTQLATDKFVFNGRTRQNLREANYRGFDAYQRSLLSHVDHLLPQSRAEVANLKKVHGTDLPFTLVRNGAEMAVFDRATPDWFVQNYGLKDFVLIVGLVEQRKNQLMLLHALRDTGLKAVVVGRTYYSTRPYYQMCQRHAPPGSIFIEHLPHEQLASVFRAARVHALPSWVECASFANVEAALSGCALVVSDRTSEKEYFGANAYYCDPANLASIRQGVLSAFNNFDADAAKRTRLQEQFRETFTWEETARQTLAGYHAAIATRQRAAA